MYLLLSKVAAMFFPQLGLSVHFWINELRISSSLKLGLVEFLKLTNKMRLILNIVLNTFKGKKQFALEINSLEYIVKIELLD